MIEDKRIYVTAEARTGNPALSNGIETHLLVNGGNLECLSYSIGSSTKDALFQFSSFQGDADFFLVKRD